MNIIVINGHPKSGKSQFVEYCLEEIDTLGREVSTIDFVKKIAIESGWNGWKTPKDRKFLSDLKDLLTEWNDVPFKKIVEELDDFYLSLDLFDMNEEEAFFFIHCREPEEIQKIKERLGAKTLLMWRDQVIDEEQSNHADSLVLDYNYDYIIHNNERLQDLRGKAISFINMFKREI